MAAQGCEWLGHTSFQRRSTSWVTDHYQNYIKGNQCLASPLTFIYFPTYPMFNVPVVGFVSSLKKRLIRTPLLCYTTSQNISPNPHFPLFHLLSDCVVDLFKRKLTGTSQMHARVISQVNALQSEPFPFLTCCTLSTICCKHAVISISKMHLICKKKKKIPSTNVGKYIFSC